MMRFFLRLFVSGMAVGLLFAGLLMGAISWAAGEQIPGLQVAEDTTFSWQVLVFIAINVAGYATTVAHIRSHMGNADIHRGYQKLTEEFPPRRECDQRHEKDKDGEKA